MLDSSAILDTDIISFWMRNDSRLELYDEHMRAFNYKLSVSFITLGELYFGARKSDWGQNRIQRMLAFLDNFDLVSVDRDVTATFGSVMAESHSKGRPMSVNDAWIAACAIRHNLTLITHNAKDYRFLSLLHLISES